MAENTVEVFLRLVDELSPEIRNVQRGLRRTSEQLRSLGGQTSGDNVTHSLEDAARAADRLERETREATGAFRGMRQADRDIAAVREQIRRLTRENERLSRQATIAAQRVRSIGTATTGIRQGLRRVTGLLAGFGAGIGIVAGIRQFRDFSTSIAEVSTLTNDATQTQEVLAESVKQVADEFGADRVDAASALYQAISAGASAGQEANELLGVAIQTAIGGVTTTEAAVDLLTTTINAFGLEFSDAERVADALFTTVKDGKTTIDELGQGFSQVAPLAASLGFAFEDVLAATATLTKQGVDTGQAFTQIASILRGAIRPTDELAAAFERFGGVDEALAELSFPELIAFIGEEAQGSEEQLGKLFGRAEAINGVLGLTGQSADTFAQSLRNQANAAGAASEAFDKVSESAGRQFEVALRGVSNAITDLAETIAPVFTVVLNIISTLLNAVVRLVEEFPLATAAAAAFGAVFATNVWLTSVTGAATAIGAIGTALRVAGAAALAFLRGPFGLIATAIVSIAAAFDLFSSDTEEATDSIKEATEEYEKASGAVEELDSQAKQAAQTFKDNLSNSLEEATTKASDLVETVESFSDRLIAINALRLDTVTNALERIANLSATAFTAAGDEAGAEAAERAFAQRRVELAEANAQTLLDIETQRVERQRNILLQSGDDAEEVAQAILEIEQGLVTESIKIRNDQLKDLKEIAKEATKTWDQHKKDVIKIEEEIKDFTTKNREDTLDVIRGAVSDEERIRILQAQIRENAAQADIEIVSRNFEEALRLARRNLQLSSELPGEVVSEQGQVLLTQAQSLQQFQEVRQRSEQQILTVLEAQKRVASDQAEDSEKFVKTTAEAVTELTQVIQDLQQQGINIELNAEESIADIREEIANLSEEDNFIDVEFIPDTTALDEVIDEIENTVIEASVRLNTDRAGLGFASGGLIQGSGTSTSDSIPIWASNNEFIMRAAAVKKYGAGFLHAINSLSLPSLPNIFKAISIPAVAGNKFQTGGLVTSGASDAGRQQLDVNLNIGGETITGVFDRDQADRLVTVLRGLEA